MRVRNWSIHRLGFHAAVVLFSIIFAKAEQPLSHVSVIRYTLVPEGFITTAPDLAYSWAILAQISAVVFDEM
jgi:hypothetical protein